MDSNRHQRRSKNCLEGVKLLLAPLIVAFALAASSGEARQTDCRVGTYRLTDKSDVDVRAIDDVHLRWQRKDGTSGKLTRVSGDRWSSSLGWTDRPDGIEVSFDCGSGSIDFAGVHGKRIEFETVDTRFRGAGVELAGRLVMPKGSAKVPIVVLVHGSEHDSAMDAYALQRLFPSAGIGAFVYDKRGTGASGGSYSQDFLTLANDAIAAVHEAKRLAGPRAGRIGYQAGSEGGWVAPLAAKIERVDFLIVGFGLAVSPLEEDREAMALNVTEGGYGADVVAKAIEVSNATAAVLLSNFRDGYAELQIVKNKYGAEPWFKLARGDVSWVILEKSPEWLREIGPTLLPGIPLNYDPMPVLRNLDTRQLWILGQDDVEAPSAETARRLQQLAGAGRPITTVIYPHAEHGIYEYEVAPGGTRLSTRQPAGYFKMMCDFILSGNIRLRYGTAHIFKSKARQEP